MYTVPLQQNQHMGLLKIQQFSWTKPHLRHPSPTVYFFQLLKAFFVHKLTDGQQRTKLCCGNRPTPTTPAPALPALGDIQTRSSPYRSPKPHRPPLRFCNTTFIAMADDRNPMTESGVTMHSDSEQYSAAEMSSPPESSSPAIVLYQPPTLWSMVRGVAINLVLPFINGMMLGFGELFAHEAAFRMGWGGTRVFPEQRRGAHSIGPGIEVAEPKRRATRLSDLTAME
ncbi:hypothetical protein MKZ38_005827 [Zalerion maritima]|uniref:Mitochondrial import protein 1 n=1 Tax=Zalerion maritima TaxID=339359 RepID=A0AAD5WU55_9PEZI|nr:hypothetical protein MKZ38_005827 [Zalerion maritima]